MVSSVIHIQANVFVNLESLDWSVTNALRIILDWIQMDVKVIWLFHVSLHVWYLIMVKQVKSNFFFDFLISNLKNLKIQIFALVTQTFNNILITFFPECRVCPAPGHICDSITGECICPPNTIGDMCESCSTNAWNYDPLNGCTLCDCSGIGADGPNCNPGNGQVKQLLSRT